MLSDPFKSVRKSNRPFTIDIDNEQIPMLIRYCDVREAAKNWQTFSSDAPFRVPIPSEEKVRSVRQLPIEIDPPRHKIYRDLIEPFFRKPHHPDYVSQIDNVIYEQILKVSKKGEVDIVREFALPIQSRSLTYLLGLPESEADIWIGWGTHVFRDGEDPSSKGSALESYLIKSLDSAVDQIERTDVFASLTRSKIEGRSITNDEALGVVNLIFAGGRDTIINAISFVIQYFAFNSSELTVVASKPKLTNLAVEEFIRVLSPLTHIGRVCTQSTMIGETEISKSSRISLCWASANFDEAVFMNPEKIILDRSPNPHIGFGSGPHTCLGAIHARLILRSLIRTLAENTSQIKIIDSKQNIETYGDLQRAVGYEKLTARFLLSQ